MTGRETPARRPFSTRVYSHYRKSHAVSLPRRTGNHARARTQSDTGHATFPPAATHSLRGAAAARLGYAHSAALRRGIPCRLETSSTQNPRTVRDVDIPGALAYSRGWRNMATVIYFRLGAGVKPGGEPAAELMEWSRGGWRPKRDEMARAVVLSLEDLASRPGFVSLVPYIDPVAMGTSYSPHYAAFFKAVGAPVASLASRRRTR